MGTRATKARCPNCEEHGEWSWIDLKPPYICRVCGYSMWEKRCINYPKNIVEPLKLPLSKCVPRPRRTDSCSMKLLMDVVLSHSKRGRRSDQGLTPHRKRWMAAETILTDQKNKLERMLTKLEQEERQLSQSLVSTQSDKEPIGVNTKVRELDEIRRTTTNILATKLELENTIRHFQIELGDHLFHVLIAKCLVEEARSQISSIDQDVESKLEEVNLFINDIINDYRDAGLYGEPYTNIHRKVARRVIQESFVKATEENVREGFRRLF